MVKTGNTKEQYLLEALHLFSEKGYGAVGVTDIAKAVGCTTSALYKHFPNKKALFDQIVERSKTEFHENMTRIHRNLYGEKEGEETAGPVQKGSGICREGDGLGEEQQIRMMKYLFEALTEDGAAKYFRRLVSVEQTDHPELAEIYNQYYIGAQLESFRKLMEIRINAGILRPGDPEMMALQYVSPLLVLVDLCDRQPRMREEALRMLEEHVRQFNRIYSGGK